jgi:hypothetical protein
LNPANGFFPGARVITNPLTGQPFPNNVIPAEQLSENGLAMLNAYPLPTPGFRDGTANLSQTSENPRDQRKDTIRLDYRLNDKNQFAYRYSSQLAGGFSGTRIPRARTSGASRRRTDSVTFS